MASQNYIRLNTLSFGSSRDNDAAKEREFRDGILEAEKERTL